MESSTLVALITAVTSIVVAVIQATTTLRVSQIKGQPEKEQPKQSTPATPQKSALHETKSSVRTWLWIGGILIVSNFIWQQFLGSYLSGYLQFGAILWCTCLLAYFQPIRWTYIASVVTVINAVPVLTLYLQGGPSALDNLSTSAILYVVNAIIAAVIGYWRERN